MASEVGPPPAEAHESRLRLQTTVRLRWVAVIGQTIAVLVVAFGLGYPMPLGACLAVIAGSAWLNVFLRLRYTGRLRLSVDLATALVVWDTLQLTILLYLTGGITNPFVVLLVAPVTVAAATLPPRNTIIAGIVALAAAAILTRVYMPLPWDADVGGALHLPRLYSWGVLAAIASCLVFLAIYTWRLSKESRQMAAALTATEMVLAHEQKLHALDGLAAAAAHELGTPLATIVLVTKEMTRDLPHDSPWREDIDLLNSQALRCRELLQKLTQRPEEQDPLHASLSVGQLLDEAIQPYRTGRIRIEIDAAPALLQGETDTGRLEPVGERRPGVIHGLGNIIENAVDFARSKVEITARWSERDVTLVVSDDGPGFKPEILETIGEPYVTTRPGGHAVKAGRTGSPEAHAGGLGLGFFIAKTLLERSGATLSFGNRTGGQTGAVIRIVWPRRSFEANALDWTSRRPQAGTTPTP